MQQDKIQNTRDKESLFVVMLAKYFTYWPVFLFFFFISIGTSFFYMKYAKPRFQATASVIIKDEKKGNDDSRIMESFNIMNTKKIIENEIDILQSRPIIDDVVKKMNLCAPLYLTNDFNAAAVYMKTPVIIESGFPEAIKVTKTKVSIYYHADSGYVVVDGKLKYLLNQFVETPFGPLKFVTNTSYRGEKVSEPFYFSLIKNDLAVKNIQDNLKVTATNKLSSVINLVYKDDDPEMAETVLNELILSYNTASTEEKKALAMNALGFIESRLNVVSSELDKIEKKIQQYKANSGAVDISMQGQLFLQNVSTNDQKLSDVNMQLMVIDQIERLISQNNASWVMTPSSSGIADPSLTQLIANLNNAELEREKLKKTVAENNPMLISIADQIVKIKKSISEYILNQRRTLEANKANILNTNKNYNSTLQAIPFKERELLEISRDKNVKSAIYAFLVQKREESELSYASTLSDSRIVNYAQSSPFPVSPNKFMVLGFAFVAAFGLPLLLINARETFSPNILYRNEVENLTTVPIIGEIGFNKSGGQIVVQSGKRNVITEEFRKSRNALIFRGVNGDHKKILVTSGISGEGKSFVAANLAISFSLAGKKVVLVDLDLHNSSLCKLFGNESSVGVSNYLTSKINLDKIVHQVPSFENLFFVSAGNLTEGLSELIEKSAVKDLINSLNEKFDVVIIDSEPIELVADARFLSEACDATLYVVRHMYSPKMLLKRFDQNNQLAPLNNPAIVFNGVKTRGFVKDNYGYNYGYGYLYGEQELSKRQKHKYA